jgi:hypothetical protein
MEAEASNDPRALARSLANLKKHHHPLGTCLHRKSSKVNPDGVPEYTSEIMRKTSDLLLAYRTPPMPLTRWVSIAKAPTRRLGVVTITRHPPSPS